MVKLIALLQPSGPAEGWEPWLAKALTTDVPGLRRLVLNDVDPVDIRKGTAEPRPFTAIIEAWFLSDGDGDAFAGRIRGAGDAVLFFVDQLLIHDGGVRPLSSKVMVTIREKPGIPREQAQHHWRTRHLEVGLVEHNATEFLSLYFQNHVRRSDQEAGSAYDFFGMPEYWLDEKNLAAVGADAPVMRALAEDEKLFADGSSIISMLLTEKEMFNADGEQPGWTVSESLLQKTLQAR